MRRERWGDATDGFASEGNFCECKHIFQHSLVLEIPIDGEIKLKRGAEEDFRVHRRYSEISAKTETLNFRTNKE